MRALSSRSLRYGVAFITTLVFLMIQPTFESGKILALLLYSISLYQVFINYKRNRMGLAVIFFFMLGYSLASINYYFFSEHISIRTEAENTRTVYYVNLYTFIFYLTVSFFLYASHQTGNQNRSKLMIGRYNSDLSFMVCIMMALICMIKGKSGENIFASGGYGNTISSLEVSSVFGYGILFVLISFFYANTRQKIYIILFVSFLYVIKDLSYGGRIDSLMLCLGIYMMYLRFVLKKKTVTILAICAFIFASVWEIYRSAVDGSIIQSITNDGSIKIGLTTGNGYDVYYASMRIIYFIESGILNTISRLDSGFYYLLATFVPFESLPPVANLSLYLQSSYSSGGGGLAPIFMFAMYGLIGVIGFGYLIGISLRRLDKRYFSIYGYFYSILIVTSCPRWYAYYPITATKYCIYGVLLLIIIRQLDKTIKTKN